MIREPKKNRNLENTLIQGQRKERQEMNKGEAESRKIKPEAEGAGDFK